MARFGRDFVRAATQPAYLEGLFTAAKDIGSLPARARQDAKLEQYKKLDPLERIEYAIANATTAEQVQQAEAAKTAFMKTESQKAINKLEAARAAAADDPNLQRQYEQSMAGIAANVGLDASGYVGRTQAEQDAVAQRELRQIQLEDKQRQQQEAAISQAYYAVPEKSREKFEINAQQSGFGNVIDELREDRERDQLVKLQLQNAKTQAAENAAMRKEPLPDSALRTRIDESSIDPELKANYKSRLDDIKQPDFEAGETWNPGERILAERAYSALNTAVSDAVRAEVNRKSAIRADIRRLEVALTKGPDFREIKSYEAQAKDNLDTSIFYDPTEEEITAEATRLATLDKEIRIQELINQRKFELGETPIPDEVPEEEEEEAKEIGGYKVKEIKGS
jgi:hypothetical protein